jgi:hypothetical protein
MEDNVSFFHIHLNDYYPEIYKKDHPKKLKKKTAELYDLLNVSLYSDKLKKFLNYIKTRTT